MRKVIASAPGKVTLFGEHAVVYGYPAIVASIGKRVYVTAREREDSVVRIFAKDLRTPGLVVTYKEGSVEVSTDHGKSLLAVSYLNKAVELTSARVGKFRGVDLIVESEMPVGAGLGTSAAVSVATVAAYSKLLGTNLRKDDIADIAWNVEREVQGLASPMDTSISTFGGYLKLWREGERFRRAKIDVRGDLPVVIAYVERKASTKEMVSKVKGLLEKYGDVIDGVMSLIGKITLRAEKALAEGDLETLGELMNINQGLLEALGVSDVRLSELIHLARSAGALGAKLTGAGGGGAVIALAPSKATEVEVALRLKASLTLRTKFGVEGVRYESTQ